MPSPANVHVQHFEAPADSDGRLRKYALVRSAERRPMAAFKGMEFDAQAAFIGGGSSWSSSAHQANSQFGRLQGAEGSRLTLMFVPKKDEERAIRSMREAIDSWGQGSPREATGATQNWLGAFDSGFAAMGVNFTPGGMFVAVLDAVQNGQLNIANATAGKGDRLLGPAGVSVEDIYAAGENRGFGHAAMYWSGEYSPKGENLWDCARYQNRPVGKDELAQSGDPDHRFFSFLRAQMEAKALRDMVSAAQSAPKNEAKTAPQTRGAARL